jgi:hypothetical protein
VTRQTCVGMLVSPLLATFTKNTVGEGRAYRGRLSPGRYLLTLFGHSTYTHFSFSHEEPCI